LVSCNFRLGNINCSPYTISQFLKEVRLLLKDKSLHPRTLLTVNAHIYNLAFKDAALRQILNAARIVTADGMSIVWASRFFSTRISERCNMTEAFRAFLQDKSIPDNFGILIGVNEEEAKMAACNIERVSSHCRIIKTVSGFLNIAEYKNIFASLGDVDFIFLGMSTPKTEQISEIASGMCPHAVVWHIGAGTIKIMAGTMKEAPLFLRRKGLQWLHRLCSNPLILWQRYLIGNPLFIYRILKISLQERHKKKHK
jgi:N-acetylglucosaminyldiphosphoundecaprenol N-acetyl-beta-D-mannosaminyltransferase